MWIIINDADWHSLTSRLGVIHAQLTSLENHVTRMEKNIMAELDDLKASRDQLLTDVGDIETALQGVVAKLNSMASQPHIDPAEVKAVADSLAGTHQGMRDAITAAQAAAA